MLRRTKFLSPDGETLHGSMAWLKAGTADQHSTVEALKPGSDKTVMSCLSILEYWEDGAKVIGEVMAHTFRFPVLFAIANPWNPKPCAFSLDDAWNFSPGTAPQTHYPNHHKEPAAPNLTFWWGVTPCPPEMNGPSLAEFVAIVLFHLLRPMWSHSLLLSTTGV